MTAVLPRRSDIRESSPLGLVVPVWHSSERDVFPGQAYAVPAMEPVETNAVASGGSDS